MINDLVWQWKAVYTRGQEKEEIMMRKYWILFAKSLKSQAIYRATTFFGTLSSALGFVIQLCLWTALLGSGVRNGTGLDDMILFITVNALVLAITEADIARDIEASVIDGSIAMQLIRPLVYSHWLLFQNTKSAILSPYGSKFVQFYLQ